MEPPVSLYAWFRVLRLRFVLSSVIAVILGLSIVYYETGEFSISYSILILAGVVFLHFSIDLLNDYWDYVKGIDKIAKRTKYSGGTGVLPEGFLKPKHVYLAGLLFLILGSSIGIYFVVERGPIVAAILAIAIFSVYTYTNHLIYHGLGEIFVGVKGSLIVLGTYYVVTNSLEFLPLYNGIILGSLSSCVLYVTSIPDIDADKLKGRKTLAIYLGKDQALRPYPIFIAIPYFLIILGIILDLVVIYSVICFISVSFMVKALHSARRPNQEGLLKALGLTVFSARIAGVCLVMSYLLAAYPIASLG